MTERPVIVITDPTATGKTALGVELALALDGEVVSADSMQVYRRMDIGTGKVTAEEARGVRHHMIDIAEPEESFPPLRGCSWRRSAWRIFSRAAKRRSLSAGRDFTLIRCSRGATLPGAETSRCARS